MKNKLARLRSALKKFEKIAIILIGEELRRISRSVSIDELDYHPFHSQVNDYIEAIEIEERGIVILHTSFRDSNIKTLRACIDDAEISDWDIIGLLDQLIKIES
jgi:hypothetical protein